MFSDLLFVSIHCFVQSQSFARPHFNTSETFFLYKVSSQCIELSCYCHFGCSLQWGTDAFHGEEKNGKSNQWIQPQCCSENKNHQHWRSSFATETQHFPTIEFLFEKTRLLLVLFFCLSQHDRGKNLPTATAVELSVQFFDHSCSHSAFMSGRIQFFYTRFFCLPVKIWSCSLKIGNDYTLKAAGLVLPRSESANFWIDIPTGIKTGRHGLAYRIWILLASITLDRRCVYVCRFPNEGSSIAALGV